MNAIWNSYPMVIAGEIIGAKETLSKHKRYAALSKSVEILSRRMTDTEIIRFYRKRSMLYRQVKIFSGYMAVFIVIMSYLMLGSFLATLAFSAWGMIVYGWIAIIVNAERKHSHIWDNENAFKDFLAFNRSPLFVPERFEEQSGNKVNGHQNQTLSFEEEINILEKESNRFNSVPMDKVVAFFRVMVDDSLGITHVKRVLIDNKDFIRFLKHRFIDDDDELLNIELINGDKSSIKALFYVFYNDYSSELYENSKKGKADIYKKLYNRSFTVISPDDKNNFSDQYSIEYAQQIREYLNLSK